jgi:hypothetical protein
VARVAHSLGPLVCYHGCDRKVAERVLANKSALRPSENDYDWLGPGVYFWVDSAQRGLNWAVGQSIRKGSGISDPYVIGAYVQPGLCLNLTDFGVMGELRDAHRFLVALCEQTGTPMPANMLREGGVFLKRALDCAVIKTVHQLRADKRETPYDTVYGVFDEGESLYPGSGFREKTHVQIAVVNPDCILGYFRIRGLK